MSAHWKWNEFWNVKGDPERLWDIMVGIIIYVADTLYPIEKLKIRDIKSDWMTDYLVRYLNRKRLTFIKATSTGKPEDLESFRKLRTTVKHLIRRHKMTYISRKL